MKTWLGTAVAITALLVLIPPVAAGQGRSQDRLDMYTAEVEADRVLELVEAGYDVTAQEDVDTDTVRVDMVLTRPQAAKLRRKGIDAELIRVEGQTVRQFSAAQEADGFQVWRSWDERGGFRDQLRAIDDRYPQITKLVKVGTTIQGRDILAIKLTQGARGLRDGRRPAALYLGLQHAREWIAGEVNIRLLRHLIDRWQASDPEIRNLLSTTELWFIPVANPDGYEYTHDVERLWRKNLRDNDNDGQTTIIDGVDLNRNFPSHFDYDEEGSSSIFSSQTYRGTGPTSEPETAALKGLMDRIGFSFVVNYHSYGEWLLYAEGWQIATPTADDPIYYALSGNLDEPAIDGYHPGLSSDVLYVTNGETTDYAHAEADALGWTPELAPGCPTCGFVFPDDEGLVQAEFERNIPFALDVAKSATNPTDPASHLGIDTKPFYLESEDAYKDGIPTANFTFEHSYGDPQPVQVVALRSLGPVTLKYSINGGPEQSASTSPAPAGERYQGASVYYRVMRGEVTGTQPGDEVEVWFEGGGEASDSFTYQAAQESNNRMLVVAAEDYTGASPNQAPGPHYLSYYLDALAANGVGADVYDVDARGRIAPDSLGVLSHYDAAIWYTGDDIVTRDLGWGPGNASRVAMDEILEFREFMNHGGRVLYTGSWAGKQYSGAAVGTQRYDPQGEIQCTAPPPGTDPRRCLALRGSGDGINDVLQYWLGGYIQVADDGNNPDGGLFDALGVDDPFGGLTWSFNGPDSADNQGNSSSYVATSGVLPADRYPQFRSWPSARWDKPGGPFEPHTGDKYVYSQIADVSYKRLTREIQVPADGGSLDFWTSYDTEFHWDFLFVEARTPGQDNWTTLPDANGNTETEPGDSCASGWNELHPFIDHYQTQTETGCDPTGTTGEWNAASGNSQGWQQWSIDLGDYAGQTVEISIAYASDWATQNLGVFLDDFTLPDGTETSFEDGDLAGWQVSGSPPGSAPNANDWTVSDAGSFPAGPAITTPDSLLLGFGFEGIATAAERNQVMGRALGHLLD